MSGRLSAEYKKRARELIISNLNRFIKRYFNDDRNLITRENDYKRYGVIERNNDGKLKLLITISRTSFPANTSVCGKYIEDFVAFILANVEGIDIVCNVDLKWKYEIVGGEIISQFNEKFGIYRQEVHFMKYMIMLINLTLNLLILIFTSILQIYNVFFYFSYIV